MRVKQNQNSQPNFGLKITKTKEFEKYSAAHGWELSLEKMEAHLEKHFPSNRDTFEISPHLVFAHKENDFFGPTYHFVPKGKKFESPKDIETAIKATIHAREELKKLSGFVSKLNEKMGLKVDFNPRNICSVVGNEVVRAKTMLSGIATGLATIPAKQKYKAKIYNDGSTHILTLNVSRGRNYQTTNFLFGPAHPRTKEDIAKTAQQAVKSLEESSIARVQSQRKSKNAARAKAKAETEAVASEA